MHRALTRGVALAFAAAALAPGVAWADQVAVLRFESNGGVTTTAQVEAARAATRDAVPGTGHTLPAPGLAAAADAVVKDGTPDTTAEYREAGRASASQWTVVGHVEAHGWTYRLELEACQVETGRVESLAREIDTRSPVPQIAEMLGLLLRPQGVGDAPPPWEQQPQAPPRAAAPPSSTVVTTAPPPSAERSGQPQARYGAEHPWSVGLGLEVLGAFARASNARGTAVSGSGGIDGGYAFAQVPGLELRAGLTAAALGPAFVRVDVGARYMRPVVRARVFLGPEARLGGFFVTGGDKSGRVWLEAALPIAVNVTDRVTIEAYPEIAYAAGGSAGLGFVGAGARGVLRF